MDVYGGIAVCSRFGRWASIWCLGWFGFQVAVSGQTIAQTSPLQPVATAPSDMNAAVTRVNHTELELFGNPLTGYGVDMGPGWKPVWGAPQAVMSPAATPTAPNYPDFKVTGVMQLDTARFGQSDESRAVLGDIQDGTGFRRSRFAITGALNPTMTYMMEFDFAQAQARFVDVWGQLNHTPLGKLRIGRFRQPFGMSELTSIRELALMERPSAFALAPFRQTGVMLFDQFGEEQGTWAFSGFRTLSDNFGNVYGDDGGLGTATRVTWVLGDHAGERLVHLGFGTSRVDPARDQWLLASQDEIFIGQQPNLGPNGLSVFPIVGVPPFVNSGLIQADSLRFFNWEAAASLGRGLVQAEHRWVRANLATGEDRTATASYMTCRWMLTGETIPYNRAGGVFGRVKPDCPLDFEQGHWGAWEIVGRISTINLNPLFGHPDVPGPTRRLLSSTVGVNWYWNANTKCQMEWVNGDLNDPLQGDSSSTTIAARFQVDF